VFIDLEGVERFSSDALLLMRAVINDAEGLFTNVGGNLPSRPAVAAKVKQSGFFRGFVRPPGDLPPPQGMMRRKNDRLVESAVAAELVDFAVQHVSVPAEVAVASYKTLVELMSNTHNHAGETRAGGGRTTGQRQWYASAYCEGETAYFSFVDLGVGILRSAAPRSFLRTLRTSISSYGEEKLLGDVFRGNIGASAEIPGRGFGLPTMRAAAEAGLLPHLRVVTASIIGDVDRLQFRTLNTALRGTVFRWTTTQSSVES
jgi:hypothetical protein